jgi:hypothetical protein
MDDDMLGIDAGDIELERRFDSYARARLSPDPGAVARVRARVMREARLQLEAARIAAYVAPAVRASRVSAVRRFAMPVLAAGVWLAIAVGAMAASQAGGPLYASRLWIEGTTLPATGGPRVEADLERLDDRISEALGAANAGNRDAVAASLEAYGVIADDARASTDAQATLVARVEEALSRHQAVLTALVAGLDTKGNDTAADAIERNLQRAIDHNAAVLETIGGHGGGAGPAKGAGGGGDTSNSETPTAGPATGVAGTDGGGSGEPTDGNGGGTAGGQSGGNGGSTDSGGAGGGGTGKPSAAPAPTPDHTPRGPGG